MNFFIYRFFKRNWQDGECSLFLIIISFCLILPLQLHAYPNHKWQAKASRNFRILYNEDTEYLVTAAASIAENIRRNLLLIYPDVSKKLKISIVLSDDSEFPNGWASRVRPVVHIDCRKDESLYRRETDWLRSVLAHELSHIYSIHKMRLPFNLFLGFNYNHESDDDNLSVSADYFLKDNRLPVWFVEGLAQMGAMHHKSDDWDPYRDMILRDAYLNGRVLTYRQMSRLEGAGLERELSYNQGFNFLLFLKERYKITEFKTLCAIINTKGFRAGWIEIYGEAPDQVFPLWMDKIKARYESTEGLVPNFLTFPLQSGDQVFEVATAGNRKAVIASWGNDYQSYSLFYSNNNRTMSISDTSTKVGMDSSGRIYFSSLIYDLSSGTETFDLHVLNPDGHVKQLTHGERCKAFSVQGDVIVWAAYQNGKTKIFRSKTDNINDYKQLVELPFTYGVYGLSISVDGSVFADVGYNGRMQIMKITNNSLKPLWNNFITDTRDVCAVNKNTIIFSSTVNGSPQIFWSDLHEPELWYQITFFRGGARFPQIYSDEFGAKIRCSVYEDGSYKMTEIPQNLSDLNPVRLEHHHATNLSKRPMGSPRCSLTNIPFRVYGFTPGYNFGYYEYELSPSEIIATEISSISFSLNGLTDSESFSFFCNANYDIEHESEFSERVDKRYYSDFFINFGKLHLYSSINNINYYYDAGGIDYTGYDLHHFWFFRNTLYLQTGQYSRLGIRLLSSMRSYRKYRLLDQFLRDQGYYFFESGKPVIDKKGLAVTKTILGGFYYNYNHYPVYRKNYSFLESPRFEFDISAEIYRNRQSDEYWNPDYYLTGNYIVGYVGFYQFRAWRSKSFSFSETINIRGYMRPFSSKYILNASGTMGGQNSFSGYPAETFNYISMSSMAFEVRFSPFALSRQQNGINSFFQRQTAGIALEGGVFQLASDPYIPVYPLSFASSLYGKFYFNKSKASTFSVKIGIPLTDFEWIKALKNYQLYLSVSL